MRSIDRVFRSVEKKNPSLGLPAVLRVAVEGKRFSTEAISRAVGRLIPSESYADGPVEKKDLIADLVRASNPSEDTQKEG